MQMRIANAAAAASRYLERIASIPGVDSAAVADTPLPGMPNAEFSISGRGNDAATLSSQLASYRIVSPGYFSALRLPLLEGRTFADSETAGRLRSRSLARRWLGVSGRDKVLSASKSVPGLDRARR